MLSGLCCRIHPDECGEDFGQQTPGGRVEGFLESVLLSENQPYVGGIIVQDELDVELIHRGIAATGKFWRLFPHANGTYPVGIMGRRLHNWTYREVTNFLKAHGFDYFEALKGSHESWIKLNDNREPDRIVEVNFTHESYPVKTLKTMIRQSGLSEEEWIK